MPAVPKNAKQPQDRQAKAEATDEPFKIEWEHPAPTKDDPDAKATATFEIDRDIANDYEVMEMFGDLEDNPVGIPKLLRHLLGREQHDRLKEMCRTENGRVDPEQMMAFFEEMSGQLGN